MITCKLCSAFYTCDVSDSRNHPFSCKLCHVVNFVSTGYIQNLHCDRSVQYLTYILSLKQPNKVYISEFTCVYDYKTNKNPLKRHGNNMSWNISNAIFKMWMFTKLQLDNSNKREWWSYKQDTELKLGTRFFLHIESWIENTLI